MGNNQNTNELDSSNPQCKALYFLGSGASAASGAPTFGNFLQKSRDISKKLKDNEIYQKVLDEWTSEFDGFNIEEFFSAIELREMITLTIDKDNKQVNVKDVTDFIAQTIEESLTKRSSEDYRKFILEILRKQDAIVTTNWDILLETEIQSKLENGDFDYLSVYPYKQENTSTDSIPLLKLHGSLNWAQCPSCNKVYYFYDKVYNKFYQKPSQIPDCPCGKPNNHLLPRIIPPTFSKLKKNESLESNDEEKDDFINQIWNRAFKLIANCREIYFIGYSFPQTDAQMRIFVSMALKENRNLEKIVIVSNEKFGQERVDFEENYRPIIKRCISKPEIQFRYNGFEGFCTDVIKEKNRNFMEDVNMRKLMGENVKISRVMHM